MNFSKEYVNTLLIIALKCARFTNLAWSDEECMAFAWWSTTQNGDASIDDRDFSRHMAAYINEGGS